MANLSEEGTLAPRVDPFPKFAPWFFLDRKPILLSVSRRTTDHSLVAAIHRLVDHQVVVPVIVRFHIA
mgnify:CR=1 FL=1